MLPVASRQGALCYYVMCIQLIKEKREEKQRWEKFIQRVIIYIRLQFVAALLKEINLCS